MQKRFTQIVEKYLLDTADSKERKAVDDFIDKLQKKPFVSLKEVQENSTLKNAVFSKIKYKAKSRKKRKFYSLITSCIALLLVALFLYDFKEGKSATNYYTTSIGEEKMVDLLDGSTVRLSPNSSLTISNDFNGSQRKVLLKGEAFFTVAKDSLKPFVITSKGFETSVLGTSFLMNEEMVAVSTGRVKVSKLLEKENFVFLNKGEKVWLLNNKLYKNATDLLSRVSSNTPSLLMDNVTLFEWKNAMEIEYGIEVLFEDSTVNRHFLVKADFRNSTLKDILQSISFVYGLDFKYENNKIIINNDNK